MRTRPLLRNIRHRVMITPVNLQRTRLIHISPSCRTIYRSFEIILQWVPSIGLEFKSNVLCQRGPTTSDLWAILQKCDNSRATSNKMV